MNRTILDVRKDFPILSQKVRGKPLVYLDSAATSQKPGVVLNALRNYYTSMNANTHSGIHTLSEQATQVYEETRNHVASFVGATTDYDIVFTKGATESINLAAFGWATKHLKRGDEILITELEHHSNIICWRKLVRKKGVKLITTPIAHDGSLDIDELEKCIANRTKLVCVTMLSNAIGTLPPINRIIRSAHRIGARVLIDGAQGVAHIPVNIQRLDCDFLAFSAHKMLGPMGLGVLCVKKELAESMDPLIYGGDMVERVHKDRTVYCDSPWRFEGGTQNVASVIAFDAALIYLEQICMDRVRTHSDEMRAYARERFSRYDRVRIIGPSRGVSALLSFVVDGVHPHDVASVFDAHGIAIRAGHHCAEPLMRALDIAATVRMSFYLYTTKDDVQKAEKALQDVLRIFS